MILRNLLIVLSIQCSSLVLAKEEWLTLLTTNKKLEEAPSVRTIENRVNTKLRGNQNQDNKKQLHDLIQKISKSQVEENTDDYYINDYYFTRDDDNDDNNNNNEWEDYVKNYIVGSLSKERPSQYSFSDIIPKHITRLTMSDPDAPNSHLIWVLVANDHRCFGGYEFKFDMISQCYGEKALTCKELKHPPTSMSGYEPVTLPSNLQSAAGYSYDNLINYEPNKYEFMKEFLPSYEVTDMNETYDETYNYYIHMDMVIKSADGMSCLGAFSSITDGFSYVEWGDELSCE